MTFRPRSDICSNITHSLYLDARLARISFSVNSWVQNPRFSAILVFMEMPLMDKIVSLCKRRGFVFPSSEIYGGFAATYDFGPLGFLLKKNIERAWRRWNVESRDDMVEIEGAIFLHPRVWEASGHVS